MRVYMILEISLVGDPKICRTGDPRTALSVYHPSLFSRILEQVSFIRSFAIST